MHSPAPEPFETTTEAGTPSAPTLSIRRLTLALFGGIILILVAFVLNGAWLTAQVRGVGQAIDLAGSQRYGLYQLASLMRRAQEAPPAEQARLMGEARIRIDRQREVYDALRLGSPKYGIGDVSGPVVDRVLDETTRQWHAEIEPLLNGIAAAPPAERPVLVAQLDARIDAFVDRDLNAAVAAFATQQEAAVRQFVGIRYALVVVGILLLAIAFLYIRRQLLAPIGTLIHDTTRIASGDYGLRTRIDARNELGTLATHFNRMTTALDSTIKGLASTVEARTRDLETSQKRLQALIDNAPDAIVAIRAKDNTIVLFSRGAELMFGYRAGEVTGRNIGILMPARHAGQPGPDDRDYRAFTHPSSPDDIRSTVARRKDGSHLDVDVSVSETIIGTETTLTTIIRDVSARIEAERAIAEKNRELEITARIDRIGARVMVALNQQEGGARWTQEVLQIIATDAGYRPLAFYQHDEWENGLLLAASLGMARTPEKQKLALGEGLVGEAAERREALFIDSTGGEAFALESGVGALQARTLFALPIVHREKLLGVVSGASQHPLSGRERAWLKQLAAQMAIGLHALQQYRELQDLSEEVNARSLRIEMQNRELAKASRLKSEFLASVSHELRTPLNAIIGFSEMLRDGLAGPLSARQVDYIGEVYQSGRHLLSLINDILDLSKIEAGKMELFLEPVNLNELLDNAMTIMRGHASHGGITLSKAVAPNIGDIVADGRKLRQIVYNLLSNAVKFTPPGGNVSIEAAVRGSDVELAVVDTGIGIAPEDQGRLFRAFEQLDSGVDRKYEGTGLGLVMVKSLVELHGGTLGVESSPGQGSRFWVRLPIRQTGKGPASPAPVPPLPAAIASQVPCVLVVDDDPAALSLARRWLTGAGYAVEMAPDCDSAWRKLERREISAILLDLVFAQGPGGWEWLERLKQQPRYASIPVIVISIVAEMEKGLALGAEAVLQKPVSGQDLLGAVESLGLLKAHLNEAPRILVVDDDPGSVERIARQLERTGMLVSRAYSGADAIASARSQSFAAVVLDLMMPDVSGIDVVRELRGDPVTAELPVIMMTSGTIEPAERARLEQSVASVLSKGQWDENRFLRVVRSAIYSKSRPAGDPPESGRAVTNVMRSEQPSRPPVPQVTVAAPPSAPGEGQAEDLIPVPPAPPGTIATILVVDDDSNTREQLRLYLETAEYSVMLAGSAEEALACLKTARPDLITLDLRLPGMSGLSLLMSHSEDRTLSGIPVLVVSGAEHPEQALGVGAHAVLCKPVRRHELLDLVMQLLSGPGPGQASRVLVVDDDPRAVTIVTAVLSAEDIDVLGVYGGQEALDAIARQPPDLVILDLMMPGVSGFEVLARLRTQESTRHIPVIVLTAKSLTERERADLATGARSVLQKTTDSQTVLGEVRRLLGMRGEPSSRNGETPA